MKLPALIDRATATLQKARSSAEVLEATYSAETALHYAQLFGSSLLRISHVYRLPIATPGAAA